MNPKLIFNWDATQYEVNHDKGLQAIVLLKDCDDIPPTIESSGRLSFFVKHFHLHNACGIVGPPVYVIANDAMQPEELFTREVEELGINAGPAWLCFTKTRGGNAAFFNFYFNSVVIPFILTTRGRRDLSGSAGPVPSAFVYCDGEASQIAVIQEAHNLELLKSRNILVGKSPASCSGILQASDVADTFKAIKTSLKHGKDCPAFTEDLHQDLYTVLDAVGNFASEKKAVIVDALRYISFTVAKCARRDTVLAGYVRTGQYPVDLEKTLSLTTHPYTCDQKEAIIAAVPHLIEHMRIFGEIPESLMDEHKIINLNSLRWSSKDNDTKPLSNQRAVIMNAETCINKYIERAKLREMKKITTASSTTTKRGPKPKNHAENTLESTETIPPAESKPKRKYTKRKTEPTVEPEPKEPRLDEMSVNTENNAEFTEISANLKENTIGTSGLLNKIKNIFSWI